MWVGVDVVVVMTGDDGGERWGGWRGGERVTVRVEVRENDEE